MNWIVSLRSQLFAGDLKALVDCLLPWFHWLHIKLAVEHIENQHQTKKDLPPQMWRLIPNTNQLLVFIHAVHETTNVWINTYTTD